MIFFLWDSILSHKKIPNETKISDNKSVPFSGLSSAFSHQMGSALECVAS